MPWSSASTFAAPPRTSISHGTVVDSEISARRPRHSNGRLRRGYRKTIASASSDAFGGLPVKRARSIWSRSGTARTTSCADPFANVSRPAGAAPSATATSCPSSVTVSASFGVIVSSFLVEHRSIGRTAFCNRWAGIVKRCSRNRTAFVSGAILRSVTDPTPAVEELPEPPWRESRETPKTPLTRQAIVEAALRVLDRDGMDALSMRKVGKSSAPERPRSIGTSGTRKSCCSSCSRRSPRRTPCPRPIRVDGRSSSATWPTRSARRCAGTATWLVSRSGVSPQARRSPATRSGCSSSCSRSGSRIR